MIIYTDTKAVQTFPLPSVNWQPDIPYIEVTDETVKSRILAKEPFKLNSDKTDIVFLSDEEVEAKLVAEEKPKKLALVPVWRIEKEAEGFSFTFSDGKTGTVQTKERDMLNIAGLVSASRVVEATHRFNFRDAENITHSMPPSEVQTMGLAAQSFISGLYQHQWDLKAHINALTTYNDVKNVTWDSV